MNPEKWYWADVLWFVKIMIVMGLLTYVIPHYDIIFSDKLPQNYVYQINRVNGDVKIVRLPFLTNTQVTEEEYQEYLRLIKHPSNKSNNDPLGIR